MFSRNFREQPHRLGRGRTGCLGAGLLYRGKGCLIGVATFAEILRLPHREWKYAHLDSSWLHEWLTRGPSTRPQNEDSIFGGSENLMR